MDVVNFYMDSQLVGSFPAKEVPISDGLYLYEPYRGSGHLSLRRELEKGKSPRCFYRSDTRQISFTVIASSSYGLLTLAGFEAKDL